MLLAVRPSQPDIGASGCKLHVDIVVVCVVMFSAMYDALSARYEQSVGYSIVWRGASERCGPRRELDCHANVGSLLHELRTACTPSLFVIPLLCVGMIM